MQVIKGLLIKITKISQSVCGHRVCRYKVEGTQTYSLFFKCLTTQ